LQIQIPLKKLHTRVGLLALGGENVKVDKCQPCHFLY
jgi:hypothetical protein